MNNQKVGVFTYLEIREYESREVVKRLDVSNQSQHSIDRIDNGMNRNLNYEKFYTFVNKSEIQLPLIN